MYEDLEFGFVEAKLMEWRDEKAIGWAFEEFRHNWLDKGLAGYRHLRFRSMADFRFLGLKERRKALDYCLEVARTRFSSERDSYLRELSTVIKETDLETIFLISSASKILSLTPSEREPSLADSINGNLLKDMIALRNFRGRKQPLYRNVEEVVDVINRERRKHTGYLGLAQQLIDLGTDGYPDEILPECLCWHYGSGTPVVFLPHPCEESKEGWCIGMLANHSSYGYKSYHVYCPEAHIGIMTSLEFPCIKRGDYVKADPDNTMPIQAVEFYQEHPDIWLKHREVLDMPELECVPDILGWANPV